MPIIYSVFVKLIMITIRMKQIYRYQFQKLFDTNAHLDTKIEGMIIYPLCKQREFFNKITVVSYLQGAIV